MPLASEVQRSSAKLVKKWGKSKSGVKEEAEESEKFFDRKFVAMPRAKRPRIPSLGMSIKGSISIHNYNKSLWGC